MKLSERLALTQWSLLLSMGVVLALVLRPALLTKGSKECESASRYDVVLAAGVGNSTVPVVTQAHFVQAPCSPPYSMKVTSYRQGSKDEIAYVLHIQLIPPSESGEDSGKSGSRHLSPNEGTTEPNFRISTAPRTRQLTLFQEPRNCDYMYDPYPEPQYHKFPYDMRANPVTPLPTPPAQIPTPPPSQRHTPLKFHTASQLRASSQLQSQSHTPPTPTLPSSNSNDIHTPHDVHPRRADMKSPKIDSTERRKPYSDGDEHWTTYSTTKPFMVLPVTKTSPLK